MERYLDGERRGGGAAEVAAELALLGDLLQQRVAGDLPRARSPQGHLQQPEKNKKKSATVERCGGRGIYHGVEKRGNLAVAGGRHRHGRRGGDGDGRGRRAWGVVVVTR